MTKPLWKGDEGKERDSILRTAWAYKAWGDMEFTLATRACVLYLDDGKGSCKAVPYRHPDNRDNDMSRDHVIGLLLIERFSNSQHMLDQYDKYFQWRISEKFCFTPDLWAWMKILAGKWWWSPVFYTISYAVMAFYVLWNKLLYRVAPFSPEMHQYNWQPQSVAKVTPRQFFLRDKLYPAYSLTQFAWQLYVLKRNVFVRGLQWLALQITGKTNYLVRLLLGADDVTEIDVRYYKMMSGGRFGTVLNESCDRHVEIIKDSDYFSHKEWKAANRLDEDLLKKIWDGRKRS